jgi:predicted AAA+ superfamily ATPase
MVDHINPRAYTIVVGPRQHWIRAQWERAANRRAERPLLILDEIQKVQGWSESVKALWDSEQTERRPLAVLLLGG